MSANETAEPPSKELLEFADYLYKPAKSGLRAREGVLNGRRVQFFKGKSALNALTKGEDGKTAKFASREEAIEWIQELLDFQLVVRCDKEGEASRQMRINPVQSFEEETYYAWLYEGSQLMIILGGIGVVAVVLAGVMFPLWPAMLRNGTWYLSMLALGLLGLLFVTAIVRLIVYVITVLVAPQGLWIFPNLFEDVGFFESFVPFHEWEQPKSAKPAAGATAAAGADDATATTSEKKVN
ncbi:Translocation protein S62 [Coemansia sp. RSA 2559]|nr:Translocation protein S62 [Coemansia sp. RSA 2559]KAJ2869400.1 Translocation protein S62 [Coemansia erecta]